MPYYSKCPVVCQILVHTAVQLMLKLTRTHICTIMRENAFGYAKLPQTSIFSALLLLLWLTENPTVFRYHMQVSWHHRKRYEPHILVTSFFSLSKCWEQRDATMLNIKHCTKTSSAYYIHWDLGENSTGQINKLCAQKEKAAEPAQTFSVCMFKLCYKEKKNRINKGQNISRNTVQIYNSSHTCFLFSTPAKGGAKK